MVHVVEERTNKRIVRAEQLVEPEIADASTAGLLSMAEGVPILRVTRLFFLADGSPGEAAITRYHPERYKLHVELLEKPPT